jgi:ABC-type transport system substrate-binding protein
MARRRAVYRWKPGRPYLDGIEYTIIKDVSTRLLSFLSGKDDAYFGVTIPQLKDVKTQAPQAICDMFTGNVARNLIVNRDVPPFDNPDLRRPRDIQRATNREMLALMDEVQHMHALPVEHLAGLDVAFDKLNHDLLP